jgi:hypothetical protein
MVRDVETLRSELKRSIFLQPKVLRCRYIYIGETRPTYNVPARIPELARLRYRIEPLKRRRINPLIRLVGATVGVAHQVRTAREVAGQRRI